MNPGRYRRLKELFVELSELGSAERPARIAAACGDDAELRAELERLLEAHEREAAVAGGCAPLPERIGEYAILGLLGEGGMGVVYRASQASPRRVVALKVVRPGAASPTMLRRFDAEAQLLARLHHPGIAQIFATGTAEAGAGPQPFFAMELIEGPNLIEHAEAKALPLAERLELLIALGRAIEHAHQKGVIHRDIKPGNVLVGSDGQVKVLDFGIARATDADLRSTTLRTLEGQLIGTLPYMSPEQLTGDPAGIDTRSDVYALGVLAFELLTGELPLELEGRPLAEALRLAHEREPRRLGELDRGLRGDLETIVAKALEKDKERRYGSAAAFADDLQRFLAHEPIVARPTTAWYRIERFARRHRGLVGGLAAGAAALVVGAVLALVFGLRAVDERDRARDARDLADAARADAERDAETMRAVVRVLEQMLDAPDPWRNAREVRVVDVLDRVASGFAEEFADRPVVEASVRKTLGVSYQRLGLYEEADEQLARAQALSLAAHDPRHPEAIEIAFARGQLLLQMQRLDEAEPLLVSAEARARERYGPHGPKAGELALELGNLHFLRNELDEAEELYLRALSSARRTHGAESDEVYRTQASLALLRGQQGRYGEAVELYRAAIAGLERTLGSESPFVIDLGAALAGIHLTQGRLAEGIAQLEATVDAVVSALGEDHPTSLLRRAHLAVAYGENGRLAEAESVLREVASAQEELFGFDHEETLATYNNLASNLRAQHRYAEAIELFRLVADAHRQLLGDEHPRTIGAIGNLGEALVAAGRLDEAEAPLRESLELTREVAGGRTLDALYCLNNLARLLERRGDHDEALPLFAESVELADELLPGDSWLRWGAHLNQGKCLTRVGEYERAEEELLVGHEGLCRTLDLADPRRAEADRAVLELYRLWNRPDEEAAFRASLQAARGG